MYLSISKKYVCPRYIYFYMFDGHMDVDWSLGSCYLYELSMETTPQVSKVVKSLISSIINMNLYYNIL